MVISAVFTSFLQNSVIFTSFTNVGKVQLPMDLLKFEELKSQKVSEFSLKACSQVWGHFYHLKALSKL